MSTLRTPRTVSFMISQPRDEWNFLEHFPRERDENSQVSGGPVRRDLRASMPGADMRSSTMPAIQATASKVRFTAAADFIAPRVDAVDWGAMASGLDAQGCAVTGPLLTADECAVLAGRYSEDTLFRSRVVMARHGFGRGEYKYFAYPLPDL